MPVGITWDKTNPGALSLLSSLPLTHQAHGRPLQLNALQVEARSPGRHKPCSPRRCPLGFPTPRFELLLPPPASPRRAHHSRRRRHRRTHPRDGSAARRRSSAHGPTLPQASPRGSAAAPGARCQAPRCPPRSGDAAGAAPLSLPQPRPPSPSGARRRCLAGPQTPQRCPPCPAAAGPGAGGPRRAGGQTRPGCRRGPGKTRGTGGSRSRCPERRPAAPQRGQGAALPLHRPRAPALPPATPPPPPGLPPRALHPPPPRRATAAPAARRQLPQGGARDPQPGGLRSGGRELPDGRGRPVGMRQPRAGKKVVPAGAAGNRTHPPARRLRRGRDSNSPSRRERQRREDPARPRRCLAAAAANRSAQRGHASQWRGRAGRARAPLSEGRGRPAPRPGGSGGRGVRAPRGGHGNRTSRGLRAAAGPGAWPWGKLSRSPERRAGSCPVGRCVLRGSARSRKCPASAGGSGHSEQDGRQRLGRARESSTGAESALPLSRVTRSPGLSLGNKDRPGGRQVWQCPSPTKVPRQEMLTGTLVGMTRN